MPMRPLMIFLAAFLILFTGSGAHKLSAAPKPAEVVKTIVNIQQDASVPSDTDDVCCSKSKDDTSNTHASCPLPVGLLQETSLMAADLRCQTLQPLRITTATSTPSSRLKRPPRSL